MGGKSVTERSLVFLLTAALCSEASLVYYLNLTDRMTWAEARQSCQAASSDLATWHALSALNRYSPIKTDVWIGLQRDQEQDSVWKWINLETGYGTAGEDVSSSRSWAVGESSRLCAVVSDDSYWYSLKCSSLRSFYCWGQNKIHYHSLSLTWDDASDYCQSNNGYLATIEPRNAQNFPNEGWLGLYREGGDRWSWVQNVSSDYTNWGGSGRPAAFDCGSLHTFTGGFYSEECTTKKQALCSGDNLLLVNERKTWEEAVRHCRDMRVTCGKGVQAKACVRHYDLVSLAHPSAFSYAKAKIAHATTDEVWVGLRFLAGGWLWLDEAEVDVEPVLPGCPPPWQRCGTLSKDKRKTWLIRDCSERKSFICAWIE